MKLQFNFHKRMAKSMWSVFRSHYGQLGTVYGVRLGPSASTLTFYRS